MEFSKRKWGYYLTVYSAKNFKIKLLYFKAGHSCSMQRHFKRSELWCFLFGRGLMMSDARYVMKGGNALVVQKNQWHQFTAFDRSLVLEIQTGTCEESDIERAA